MVDRYRITGIGDRGINVYPADNGEWVRYAALEAQLAERVKVDRAAVVEILNDLSRTGYLVVYETDDDRGLEIDEYATLFMTILSALEATPPAPKATEAMREFAAKQSSTDTDIRAALGSRSELYFAAPKVTEAGPVPTYECEFRVGQPVRPANPYAEDDPDRTFYVTGIDWEYRSVVGHGWNITVATAEEIARGYGATDGFTPSDLTAAQEAGKP